MTLLLQPDATYGGLDEGEAASNLWAWVAVDDTDKVCLIAGHVPGVGMCTLVTTNETHARTALRHAAVVLAGVPGRAVQLRRYELADVVEQL